MGSGEIKLAKIEAKELQLVADTNLFFEFKKLEELPWGELNADPILILITKPVLDEIDKHKKNNGRTRDRAMSIFQMLRNSFKAGGADTVIREDSPRVLLRHVGSVAPDEKLQDKIDFYKNDDRLVGILSTLINKNKAVNIVLFTDDTGPVSTAQGLGLPFKFIEDHWRRPAEQTSETKRIKALEKDLDTYRAQEPDIRISYGDTVVEGAVRVVSRVAKPLTSEDLQSVMQMLKSKHPLQDDFTPPPRRVVTHPVNGERTEYIYEAPSQKDIANYRDVDYPKWLGKCQTMFGKLGEQTSPPEEKETVSWTVSNEGTRPASQVRIEFKAEGAIALVRTSQDDNEDDCEDEDSSYTQPASQQALRLPSPPNAPAFKETKEETIAPKSKTAKGLDIAKIGQLEKSISKLPPASAVFRAARSGLDSPLGANAAFRQFHSSPFSRILEDQRRFENLTNPSYLKTATAFAFPTIEPITPLIDYNALRAPEHTWMVLIYRKKRRSN